MGLVSCGADQESKQSSVKRSEKYIRNKYHFGKTLGKGGSCSVMLATEKATGSRFALKLMCRREKISRELYESEIHVLRMLDHPNIIKFVESHSDTGNYYIVTQLCVGGELFDRIVDKNYSITEKKASEYVQTMLFAIEHCHDKKIVHRDIKPENFVFKTKDPDSEMVLIDFGCAKLVEDNMRYDDLVGTPYYLAPELACGRRYIRTGKVLKSSDLWSIGVVAYVLMTGRPPFNGQSNKELFTKIIRQPLQFPSKVELSSPFKEFIKKILKKSPIPRITVSEALNDPWVKGEGASESKFSDDILRVLRQFNQQSKLKKAITKSLAAHMGRRPKKQMEEHFNRLDRDGNGALCAEELSFLLMDMGYAQAEALKEAKQMITSTDYDNSGTIEFSEFAAVWQRKLLKVNESYIHTVFNVLDADGDGFVDKRELALVLGMNVEKDDVKLEELIVEVDSNNDGKISFAEFRAAMLEKGDLCGSGTDVGQKLDANEVEKIELDVDIDETQL